MVLGAGLLVVLVDILLTVGLGMLGVMYDQSSLPAGWLVATATSSATLLGVTTSVAA